LLSRLSYEFHIDSIAQIMKIVSELRIFSILTLDGKPSPYIDGVINYFLTQGMTVEFKKSIMNFKKGEIKCWLLVKSKKLTLFFAD